MAFKMDYRTTRWGSWVSFDIPGNGMAVTKLTISYAHASRLDWYITANETTAPIPRMSWVRLWDDTGVDENGNPQTNVNPLFFGRISEVSPGSHSNQVMYVAFDPTYWSAKNVAVLSLPYDLGSIPTSEPQGYVGAVPRMVYNVKNTADEDYAYAVGQNGTVGEIIGGIFDYCYQPLYWLDAAPGDGSNAGNGSPYVPSDLAGMDFIPQQKIVWESLTVRAAVEQMWRNEPRYRMLWHPASKQWRFHHLASGSLVNLKVNDTGLVNPHPMIGLDIKPNYEDCQTAVSIYGPPTTTSAVLTWDDTMTTFGDDNIEPIGVGTVLENYSDALGMQQAVTWQVWKIHDPLKRPGSRILLDWVQMGVDQYQSVPIRFPTFQVSWNYGGTWIACSNVWFDFLNGTVNFIGTFPYCKATDSRGQSVTPNSTQTIFVPNACRLYWAPYDVPLSVRYPASGFSGSAYSVAGITSEYRLYDESLAIGKEYGVPVTSSARRAQFTKLAQYLHETRKDVIYTGAAVLDGIDYSWCRLGKRVNIQDAAGTTTGWESINAIVTDVEYTYGDQPATTLTFNANWAELYGDDMGRMKEELRIRSFTQKQSEFPTMTLHLQKYTTYFGNQVNVVQGVTFNTDTYYQDDFGNVQRSEGRR